MKKRNVLLRTLVGVSLGVLVLGLLVTGCKEEKSGGVNINVSSGDNLCREISEMMCKNMFQCCTGLEIENTLGIEITTHEKECRHDMELYCEEQLARVIYSLEEGTSTLHTDDINACLNASLAPSDTCFEVEFDPEWMDLCLDVLFVEGKQGAGSGCYWDFECQPEHFCAVNMECRALLTAGEDCTGGGAGQMCGSDLFCGPNTTGDWVCQQYRTSGQACFPTFVSNEAVCDPEDLYCGGFDIANPDVEGVCQSKKSLAANCLDDLECASDQCAPGYCMEDAADNCYQDSDCQGSCSLASWGCDDEFDCPGTCSASGGACDDEFDCTDPGTETCDHEACDATCVGQAICVDEPLVVDYCAVGLGVLGHFPTGL